MTQTELADRLYVTEKAVSKWECGNGLPDLDNIGKLAAIFDISIDELLQAEEKSGPEAVSEGQILQLQAGNSPLINCYEDIVVYRGDIAETLTVPFYRDINISLIRPFAGAVGKWSFVLRKGGQTIGKT